VCRIALFSFGPSARSPATRSPGGACSNKYTFGSSIDRPCGGPATLIDDGTTGFLAPTGDAEALAERMAHVLAHSEVAKDLSRAERERIETEFSVEAAGARFPDVYDELMDSQSVTA
jgi:glycosyltransferase involved in cell wall biosynthesis